MSDRDAPLGDDELLALLASSLEGFTFDEGDDPVPPAVEENSKWLHTFTQLEAELAELVSDSAIARPEGVRSSGGARRISYAIDEVDVELEVELVGSGRRLISGRVLPAMVGEVRLVVSDTSQTAVIDPRGRFRFTPVSAGLTLIVIEGETRRIRIDPLSL